MLLDFHPPSETRIDEAIFLTAYAISDARNWPPAYHLNLCLALLIEQRAKVEVYQVFDFSFHPDPNIREAPVSRDATIPSSYFRSQTANEAMARVIWNNPPLTT